MIARVHGIATAAGCQLVAACDLAVAAADARFATSGINFGLFCATPGVPVSRNVSRKRAFEMLMTGEFIDAPTALDWGLVNRVVAARRARRPRRAALARTLLEKPAAVLAAGKRFFYEQLERDVAEAYALAARTITCNMLDPDGAGRRRRVRREAQAAVGRADPAARGMPAGMSAGRQRAGLATK